MLKVCGKFNMLVYMDTNQHLASSGSDERINITIHNHYCYYKHASEDDTTDDDSDYMTIDDEYSDDDTEYISSSDDDQPPHKRATLTRG